MRALGDELGPEEAEDMLCLADVDGDGLWCCNELTYVKSTLNVRRVSARIHAIIYIVVLLLFLLETSLRRPFNYSRLNLGEYV
jgi:hypothetical protein